jgi:hypothetical protein
MKTLVFSSDSGQLSIADINETSRISEIYFQTQNDSTQISTSTETRDWILTHAQNYLNVVKEENKIIGYSFLLPCSLSLMDEFLTERIDESTLFFRIREASDLIENPQALYLCASVIIEKYQRKGIATEAFVKMIQSLIRQNAQKPILFCWEYSQAGGKLARKIAKITGLELKIRSN